MRGWSSNWHGQERIFGGACQRLACSTYRILILSRYAHVQMLKGRFAVRLLRYPSQCFRNAKDVPSGRGKSRAGTVSPPSGQLQINELTCQPRRNCVL